MTDDTLILAFETSGPSCNAAVICGGRILAARSEPMVKGQAERLLLLCEALLSECSVAITDLSAIGVGTGPGNFTGLRISVAAARGLALGLRVPAVGVSAFDALRLGTNEPCACTVDARRGQVYVQDFGATDSAGPPRIMDADALPGFLIPVIGAGGRDPHYPSAVAIALITQERFATQTTRPAPLYLRPADAAPAKDAAPTLLT